MVRHPLAKVLLSIAAAGLAFVAAGSALAAGGAAADGDGSSVAAGDRVTLPEPAQGDHGTYAVHLLASFGNETFELNGTYSFVWNGTARVGDRDGRTVDADRIETMFVEPGDEEGEETEYELETVWVEAGSYRVVRRDSFDQREDSTVAPGLVPLLDRPETHTGTYRFAHFDVADADCLLTFPLRSFTAGEALRLPAACGVLGFGSADTLDPVPDEPLRWEGRLDGADLQADFRLTFVPGLAVPTQAQLAFEEDGGTVAFDFTLAGFDPGSGERAAAGKPTAPPAARYAPLAPWGMPEGGIEHPFPASAAYAILEESTDANLTAFRARHATWHVASGVYTEILLQTQALRAWVFVLYGDGELLEASVAVHDPLGNSGAPLPAGLLRQSWVSTQPPEETWATYAPTSMLPESAPTVESLLDRWTPVTGNASVPNGWSFGFVCADEACAEAAPSYAITDIGSAQSAFQPGVPPRLASESTMTLAWAAFDDRQRAEDAFLVELRTDGKPIVDASGAVPGSGEQEKQRRVPVLGAVAGSGLTPGEAAGAGAVAVLVGGLTYLLASVKGGAAALFSRLMPDRLGDHPARRTILQAIEAEPGVHFKELARRTRLANGTLVHHLRLLAKAGKVVARPAGGYTCYFLGGGPVSAPAAAAQKADGAKAILEAVRANPGLSGQEIAARTGLQASTVSYHAQRLSDAGLLRPLRDGRAVRFHPSVA